MGNTGSNNWPLRGSKVSDFEGGVRTVAFLAGGYLPPAVRGGSFSGFISMADWCECANLPSRLCPRS